MAWRLATAVAVVLTIAFTFPAIALVHVVAWLTFGIDAPGIDQQPGSWSPWWLDFAFRKILYAFVVASAGSGIGIAAATALLKRASAESTAWISIGIIVPAVVLAVGVNVARDHDIAAHFDTLWQAVGVVVGWLWFALENRDRRQA